MKDQDENGVSISERIARRDALITLTDLDKIAYSRKPSASVRGQHGRATAGQDRNPHSFQIWAALIAMDRDEDDRDDDQSRSTIMHLTLRRVVPLTANRPFLAYPEHCELLQTAGPVNRNESPDLAFIAIVSEDPKTSFPSVHLLAGRCVASSRISIESV
jgi:hypothetical protein